MVKRDITMFSEEYFWLKSTLMRSSYGRSFFSCQPVEVPDQGKTCTSDITHRLCVVVRAYFLEEANFREEIAGENITDQRILGSWRYTKSEIN